MLKKVLATVAVMGVAVLGAHAQGTVEFRTSGTGNRITTAAGVNIDGNAGMAQLYAAAGLNAAESSLTAVGTPTAFRTGAAAGLITGGVVTVPTTTPGGAATVQIRAWTGPFASYEAALAGGGAAGKSPLINLAATGNPLSEPPGTPVGLPNTPTYGFAVPEPSSIALGILGVAGLALFRRRK